jgi:hypothetical protein
MTCRLRCSDGRAVQRFKVGLPFEILICDAKKHNITCPKRYQKEEFNLDCLFALKNPEDATDKEVYQP